MKDGAGDKSGAAPPLKLNYDYATGKTVTRDKEDGGREGEAQLTDGRTDGRTELLTDRPREGGSQGDTKGEMLGVRSTKICP